MKIYCFDPKKNKKVIVGDFDKELKIFTKKVRKNHFMILEKGYGIQEEVLQNLKELGCLHINIKTKISLICTQLEDWLKQSIKNYSYGNQRFF
jgi:hypothetical protein